MAKPARIFRIGITINRQAKVGSEFGQDLKTFRSAMEDYIKKKGAQETVQTILDNRFQIVKEIHDDVEKFGARAAKYFTNLKSPDTPAPAVSKRAKRALLFTRDRVNNRPTARFVTVELDKSMLGQSIVSRTNDPSQQAGPRTLTWAALSHKTIRNKRRMAGPHTFFLASGNLKAALTAGLGEAYAEIVNPSITFDAQLGPNGEEVGTIKVKALMNQGARTGPRFRPSLLNDFKNSEAVKSERLILAYLKVASIERAMAKLSNIDKNHQGPYRPFLQPALAFWVLNRFGLVFRRAVERAVKNKARGKIYGGQDSSVSK